MGSGSVTLKEATETYYGKTRADSTEGKGLIPHTLPLHEEHEGDDPRDEEQEKKSATVFLGRVDHRGPD